MVLCVRRRPLGRDFVQRPLGRRLETTFVFIFDSITPPDSSTSLKSPTTSHRYTPSLVSSFVLLSHKNSTLFLSIILLLFSVYDDAGYVCHDMY